MPTQRNKIEDSRHRHMHGRRCVNSAQTNGNSPRADHQGDDASLNRESRSQSTIRKVIIWPFVILIRLYQVAISPFTPAACRFYPTCSAYGLEAFRRHGLVRGIYLTIRRLMRCNPWGGSGYDPVP